MSCKNPINIFLIGKGTEWNESRSAFGRWVECHCQQCGYCRFVRTRQWALRCYLENQCHQESAFLNLSYAPEHLPEGKTLVVEHMQKFMKRLRSNVQYQYKQDKKIRFYLAGEYGEKNHRPHYHVLIFGFGFPDKKYFKKSEKSGLPLYRSDFLEKTWKFGHSWIGDVEIESAAYVANYIRKKINGDEAEEHYKGRQPEFALQSTSPGIGADWYEQNKSWLWKEDVIECNRRYYRPPRYFEKLFEKEDPQGYQKWINEIRSKRKPLKQLGYAETIEAEKEDD